MMLRRVFSRAPNTLARGRHLSSVATTAAQIVASQRGALQKSLPFLNVDFRLWSAEKKNNEATFDPEGRLEIIRTDKGRDVFVVELPKIDRRLIKGPKGFDINFESLKIVLDEQRMRHVQEFVNHFDPKWAKAQRGVLFSGPNGVGKSSICLATFLTCFVRALPVLYIPSANVWVTYANTLDKANKYFLEQFYLQNADLIERDEQLRPFFSFAHDHAASTSPSSWTDTYYEFGTAVWGGNVRQCGFIVDEAQSLFDAAKQDKPFFAKDFTVWTGISAAFASQLCGSAYGQHENKLSSGERRRLRFIQPCEEDVTRALLCDERSPFFVPHCAHDTMLCGDVIEAFGGMPRPLWDLARDVPRDASREQVVEVLEAAKNNLKEELGPLCEREFIAKCTNPQVAVDYMRAVALGETPFKDTGTKPLYDYGLCYRRNDGKLALVHRCAEELVLEYWCSEQARVSSAAPLHTFYAGDERGSAFEKYLLGAILGGSRLRAKPLRLLAAGDDKGKLETLLPHHGEDEVFEVEIRSDRACFLRAPDETHYSLPANLAIHPKYRTLWIPDDEDYLCDGIIVPSCTELTANTNSPVLLIETSVTNPYERKPKKYQNLQKMRAVVQADPRFRDMEVMIVLCYDGEVDSQRFKQCTEMKHVENFQGIVTLDKTQLRRLRITF